MSVIVFAGVHIDGLTIYVIIWLQVYLTIDWARKCQEFLAMS